jgi:dihydropteroate synthase
VAGAPVVRVEDGSLVPAGGPARISVSRLPRAYDVAHGVGSAGGVTELVDGRLVATARPSQLVDAAGRKGGPELAETLRHHVDAAVGAWLARPPDLWTPAGTLPCSRRPVVMGIVNVTPDSFSDGGVHYDPDRHPEPALGHARRLLAEGADVIDVGGESTRPGAEPVGEAEELRRVVPLVEALAADGAVVSVDTMKSGVARRAVRAGAALVNDVSAGARDGLLLQTVAELQVPYVVMHMRGSPRTMQRDPRYADVVAEVFDFLSDQVRRLELLGLPRERVVVDPGIGFGKTVVHNLELLRRVREFTSLGRPVLIGTSRKSFLGATSGVDAAGDRLEGSLATAALAVAGGAAIVRVHDVAATVRAVRTAHAVTTGALPERH